jgi:hypothetical protein
MIKTTKILIGAGAFVLVVGFIIAAMYITSLSTQMNIDSATYNARKEELISQQQMLELMISDLNNTLNKQIGINQQYSQKLQTIEVLIANASAELQIAQTIPPPVQVTPPTQTAPTPRPTAPAPTPAPVTRAS